MTAGFGGRGEPAFRATYRVQFNDGFTFADAEGLAPYFAGLGISHLYASPIFEARAGSAHGYDMVDPTRVSAALGGEAGFRRMAAVLAREGIGIILDIVPNHMATDAANPYWMDVLEFGADAASNGLFDIDFTRRIALPWLDGDGPAIEALRFDGEAGRVVAIVASNPVPLRPDSVARLLDRIGALEAAAAFRAIDRGPQEADFVALARDGLRAAVADAGGAFERALAHADRDALHAAQHWQAVPWRQTEVLNYRRFFEVTHLIGVRIEQEAAFELVHRLPLALVGEGLVQGLRIDHIDGLADPAAYAARLREASGPDTLILIEKILGADEALRPWPVDGTTGYERLNLINGAFVSAEGRARLQGHIEAEGLIEGSPAERLFAAKAEVVAASFQPELARLADAATPLLSDDPPPRSALEAALTALLASFPVYRSYVAALPADEADAELWAEARRRLAVHAPASEAIGVRLARAALTQPGAEADRFRRLFQQLSSPAMAKGFEDTELYRSVALTSVNEVGSDLVAPTPELADLHAGFAAFGPRGLTPLATHDTKRGADTRARLNQLSHHVDAWLDLVSEWTRRHRSWKRDGAPDALDEWFVYQTLYGAWPLTRERAQGYFEKALREAKRHGRWTDPDTAYEAALKDFVAVLVEGPEGSAFRRELKTFIAATARATAVASLAQTVLQLTLPGIPDLYRGTELADFSLVDPDNRRPVDWKRRVALAAGAPDHVPLAEDGERVTKFRATRALLTLRAREPALFTAPYEAMDAEPGWLAFRRRGPTSEIAIAVPLTPAAADRTEIRLDRALDGRWLQVMTGAGAVVAEGRAAIDKALPLLIVQRRTRAEPPPRA